MGGWLFQGWAGNCALARGNLWWGSTSRGPSARCRGRLRALLPSPPCLCSLKGCSSLENQSVGRQAYSLSWMSFSAMGTLGLVWQQLPIPISPSWPATWTSFGWLKPRYPGEDTEPLTLKLVTHFQLLAGQSDPTGGHRNLAFWEGLQGPLHILIIK